MLNLLQPSSTFRNDPQMNMGTLLKCDCGWQGPLKEATFIEFHKRNGDVESCHYVCKKCMLVLASEPQTDPPTLVDQANGTWKPIHKRPEP